MWTLAHFISHLRATQVEQLNVVVDWVGLYYMDNFSPGKTNNMQQWYATTSWVYNYFLTVMNADEGKKKKTVI